MSSLEIGKLELPYKIVRTDRESVGFSMGPGMRLVIRAPEDVSREKIDKLIQEKKPWILKKIKEIETKKPKPLEKEFLSGEKLLYHGRRYKLKVIESEEEKLSFNGQKFKLFIKDYAEEKHIERAKSIVEDWYKEKAKEKLPERVDKFSKKINVRPKRVEVKELTKKWGNVKDGKVQLNWQLIMTPVRIQRYIIVHELTHLKHPNHNGEFWNSVGAVVPDYEDRTEWLRKNGNLFNI